LAETTHFLTDAGRCFALIFCFPLCSKEVNRSSFSVLAHSIVVAPDWSTTCTQTSKTYSRSNNQTGLGNKHGIVVILGRTKEMNLPPSFQHTHTLPEINCKTWAGLFESRLTQTQVKRSINFFGLKMLFSVYVLCSLKLFNLKTEGQTK